MKNYSIGLDIGTNSVGWAVINDNYDIVRGKGKHLWGANLFSNGETAKTTRQFRQNRRRSERKKERIRLLQEIMSDMVLSADPSFYIKMKESSLLTTIDDEYSPRKNHFNLFNEKGFTDKEYNEKYPTIYHLRNHLMQSKEKEDPRLIYLAIHHIVKYRGNFLYENGIESSDDSLDEILKEYLNLYLDDLGEGENVDLELSTIPEIVKILKDKTIKKKDKEKWVDNIIEGKQEKLIYKNLFKAILGYKFNGNVSFNTEKTFEDGKNLEISFSASNYEEIEGSLDAILEDKITWLTLLKKMYTSIVFSEVTMEKKYISEAMQTRFEIHKNDLRELKSYIKNNIDKEQGTNYYDEIFRKTGPGSYASYIGKSVKKTSAEEFFNKIKKLCQNNPKGEEILKKIENEEFLPLINHVRNSTIPYQYNEMELEAILDNQAVYYPALKENKGKILSLLTFRRPYYVGPLKTNSRFNWYDKKIEEQVYPWNFYDLVDLEYAQEKFISTLTNNCRIFPEEEVLPLNSILYQAYICLNELNGIKINQKNISVDIKQKLFKDLVCKKKTISKKDLCKCLQKNYNITVAEENLTGISDEKLLGKMSTLIDFKNILGEDFKESLLDKYEEIIRYLTIFNDEKSRKQILNRHYSDFLTDNQIKKLTKLNYANWGAFSKKVLRGVYGNNQKTILDVLYETNDNFNRIRYSEEFGFKKILVKETKKIDSINYKRDIEKIACSPSIKKAIWHACQIVEEIVAVIGGEPDYIYIETTKEDEVKKRKESRKEELQKKYLLFKSSFKEEMKSLSEEELKDLCIYLKDAEDSMSDKLYLYFTQLGRDMYTEEVIDIERLEEYEIDHIVPRAYIKDDSIENRVLVHKLENQQKSNTLALSFEIRDRMKSFWKMLLDKKLIGEKKYNNLMKSNYSEQDIAGFINRQLVETNQIIAITMELFSQRFDKSRVVGVRSKLSSEMRKKEMKKDNTNGFCKIRELNDMHHAKDAYLAAVLGQFTTKAYPLIGENISIKLINDDIEKANQKEDVIKLSNKKYGIVLDAMDRNQIINRETGEIAYDNTSYNNILKVMARNDCLITKQTEYFANSSFYLTQYEKDGSIPKKYINGNALDVNKYGGYKGEKQAYFVGVSYLDGKKEKSELLGIPVLVNKRIENGELSLKEYVASIYKNCKVINKHIPKYQEIIIQGHKCYITAQKELNSAEQLIIDHKYERFVYSIFNSERSYSKKYLNKIDEKMYSDFVLYLADKIDKLFCLYKNIAEKMRIFVNDGFEQLSKEQKQDYIKKILTITKSGSGRVDKMPSEYKCGSAIGRLNGKTINPNEVVWIYRSITGVYSYQK